MVLPFGEGRQRTGVRRRPFGGRGWPSARVMGPSTLGTGGGSGPAPVGGAYDGVDASTISARSSFVALFNGTWAGHTGQTFATDQLCTSLADLIAKFNGISRVDRSQWHRLRLDSTQSAATWAGSLDFDGQAYTGTLGALYGGTSDWATSGGGVVIESSDANNMVTIYQTGSVGVVEVRGVRGLHLRNFNIGNCATGITSTNRDAVVCFQCVGNSTRPDAPAVMLENVGFGLRFHPTETDIRKAPVAIATTGSTYPTDILIAKNCRFRGCQTGVKSSGVKFLKTFGNDFREMVGDCVIPLNTATLANIKSAYSEECFHWSRGNTERQVADNAAFSDEHKDFVQHGTSGDTGGYRALSEFDVAYMKRNTGTDKVIISFSGQPADGSSVTIGGTAFTFVASGPTGTQVLIGANLSATLDNLLTVFTANLPANMDRGIKSSTTFTVHFNFGFYVAPTRTTSPASNATIGGVVRTTGGTQGQYNDDLGATLNADHIIINCIMAGNGGLDYRLYNGTAIIDRCIAARPGDLPPDAILGSDGHNASQDFVPYVSLDSKTATTVINHTIRSSVFDYVADEVSATWGVPTVRRADGTYTDGVDATVVLANNRSVQWAKATTAPNRPQDLLAGTFGTDANSRFRYDFTDDGSQTQQVFRQAVYDQLKLANTNDRATIGTTDPASWVAELAA